MKFTKKQIERYSRQIILKKIGVVGQKKLLKSSVLIIGSGGREHAFAWSFYNDTQVDKIYCCPGNGGTESIAQNIKLDINNHHEIADFVVKNNIDLTIVGPEGPLADGIVDIFKKYKLRIFGPDKICSKLRRDPRCQFRTGGCYSGDS